MKTKAPSLPLPEPLIGAETGTFTEFTVTQRMPAIARRVIAENNFPSHINEGLENLAKQLPSGYLIPLSDDTGIDVAAWQKYLQPYQGKRWIDVPWFFAETYFYRLILNITNYFLPSAWQGVDPFQLQKSQGLKTSLDATITLCDQLTNWLSPTPQKNQNLPTALATLLYFALWGNRADLSLWSAFESDRTRFDIATQQAHILVDDVPKLTEFLLNGQPGQIAFIADNAGFELICDLALIDVLLTTGTTNQIQLHLKPHPTFVSDATIKDVGDTVDFLATSGDEKVANLAQRLQTHLASKKLILCEDYFWTSPLAFWEIPDALQNQLANASLLLLKGDANYRRLLGDRHWDFSTNMADIVSYLPVPLVALRTLKSEVAAGIPPQIVETVAKSDPHWLTNGQWGMVQLVFPPASRNARSETAT